MRKGFLIGLFLFALSNAVGQDTIRVMYYNLLNFPSVSPERVTYLRKIIAYSQPDILVVNELLSAEGSDLILNEALNVGGVTHFEAATYVDGPDTDNMLYYNAELLGLRSQLQIPTGLRDISEYELFYKSPGLSASADTVIFHVYSLHLKAGSGYFNQRKEEAILFKYHLNTLSNAENIIAGGDFNFYSGNESGHLAMRETGSIDLFDPINSIGDWNNNAAYAYLHTQSTRETPLADGAGGGMDDRFDLIFISNDLFENTNGARYITDSYHALGQDGSRFNQSINVPFNPSIPDSIANALYFMSDHLPLFMDVLTDYTAGLTTVLQNNPVLVSYNSFDHQLTVKNVPEQASLVIYDLTGKALYSSEISEGNPIKIPATWPKGIYVWNVISESSHASGKISI